MSVPQNGRTRILIGRTPDSIRKTAGFLSKKLLYLHNPYNMSVVKPTQNQILNFLKEFRESKKETSYDMAVNPNPYPDNMEKSFLFQYCLRNGYIGETDQNRFHTFFITYLGEGLLLSGKSPIKRFRLWIEDHPSAWATICAAGGYLFPFIHEFLRKTFT